jgi:hypothetical protein
LASWAWLSVAAALSAIRAIQVFMCVLGAGGPIGRESDLSAKKEYKRKHL